MALEQLYSHYKRPRTAILMGHARGVICLAAAAGRHAGHPLFGHAGQEDADRQRPGAQDADAAAIHRELALAAVPEPPDVADALAVALCHYYLKVHRTPLKQKEV